MGAGADPGNDFAVFGEFDFAVFDVKPGRSSDSDVGRNANTEQLGGTALPAGDLVSQ